MVLAGALIGLAGFLLKAGVADLSLGLSAILGILLNPILWVAGVVAIAGFLLMQKALHMERVAIVSPMVGGVSIVLPVLLAWVFLGEIVSDLKWIGIVLILIGVAGLGK